MSGHIGHKAAIVYADGAARGNPGPAGAGWVLCDADGRPQSEGGAYLGHKTNNEAEYMAAQAALTAAEAAGCTHLILRADSELMVRQISGRYQVRNARLRVLYDALMVQIRQFTAFEAEHVPRSKNALADAQANRAIDEHTHN